MFLFCHICSGYIQSFTSRLDFLVLKLSDVEINTPSTSENRTEIEELKNMEEDISEYYFLEKNH